MSDIFIFSALANIVLVLAVIAAIKKNYKYQIDLAQTILDSRQTLAATQRNLESLIAENYTMYQTLSTSIMNIKDDLLVRHPSYAHADILNSIAVQMSEQPGPIELNDDLRKKIYIAGAGKFIKNGKLNLVSATSLAWEIHASAVGKGKSTNVTTAQRKSEQIAQDSETFSI